MAGGIGTDCEERLCPFGLVPTTNAYAVEEDSIYTSFSTTASDIDSGMHSYAECSASGVCDRAIGTCQCNDDRDGAACERNKCPNNCNFNGLCRSLSGINEELIPVDGLLGTTVGWNSQTYHQCDCDPGWFGGDCSLRSCPIGVNPVENCAEDSYIDIQSVDLSLLNTSSFFVLQFTTLFGSPFTTRPLAQTATAGSIQRALERLPNIALPSVQVSRDDADSVQITFTDRALRGRQNLIECNPQTLLSSCTSGTQPKFDGDSTAVCGTSRVGEPEFDSSKGYFKTSTCSSQGICNSGTGICECFDGFYGNACENFAQIS